MYKVIKHFVDLKDKNREYNAGDIYPREGLNVSKARLEELASSKNRRGEALIELVEEEEPVIMPEEVEAKEEKPAPKKPAAKKAKTKK